MATLPVPAVPVETGHLDYHTALHTLYNHLNVKGALVAGDPTAPVQLLAGADGLPLVANSLAAAGLGYAALGSAGIAAGAVTTAKLGNLSVSTAKLIDLAVATGKLADLGVTTAKLADLSVTTGKIADLAVTTAKVAAGAVTVPKIGATGTPDATTYLRGDGTWAAGSGGAGSVRVENNDTVIGTRGGINFIPGTGITLSMADDAAGDEVDVTIASNATSPVFINASSFGAMAGTPVIGAVGANRQLGWLLDPAIVESIVGAWDMPDGWATINADLYWTNPGTGTGNVVFRHQYENTADAGNLAVSGALDDVTVAAPAQNVLKVTRVTTGRALTAANFQSLRLLRVASDAADTLANDAAVLGVLITRAS